MIYGIWPRKEVCRENELISVWVLFFVFLEKVQFFLYVIPRGLPKTEGTKVVTYFCSI